MSNLELNAMITNDESSKLQYFKKGKANMYTCQDQVWDVDREDILKKIPQPTVVPQGRRRYFTF